MLYFATLVAVIKPLMVSQTQGFVKIFPKITIVAFSETSIYCFWPVWRGRPNHCSSSWEWVWIICQRWELHAICTTCELYCNVYFWLKAFTLHYIILKEFHILFDSVSSPEESRSSCWHQTTGRAWVMKGWREVMKITDPQKGEKCIRCVIFWFIFDLIIIFI